MSDPRRKVPSIERGRRTGRVVAAGARWVEEVPGMDREKMLDVTLGQIERQFGKGAVMRLGEHPAGQGVPVIPTGSLALDMALGIGGIPRGRIVEGFEPAGSGTTTVSLHTIAEGPRRGAPAAVIDAGSAVDAN